MDSNQSAGMTQSLCKAFDILACFSPETPQLRVSDFTKRLNITQSNISRILKTMVAYEFVSWDEETGYYRLGTRIITLSSIALNSIELRKQALPELFLLEQEYGVGANLAIRKGTGMYYLAHVDSRSSPRMYTMIGYTNPLHCTAIGKVLLASLSDEEIKGIIREAELPAFTRNTIISESLLMEQIGKIRLLGYATEYEEHALGSACIAAPIRDCTGKVIAGLSVSGQYSQCKLFEREDEVASIVINSANIISHKMGYF
ncbi:MAG: IclR family transcriptional regulator [Ruminococcaceae bacterium]|nr:IclR family transcriptional regulator [Oscillospiraceae bacterium]